MAVDKLVDSTQLDADLTSVANAIRTKGGTSAQLAFPVDFVSAIEDIETGGGGDYVGADWLDRTKPVGEVVDNEATSIPAYALTNRTGVTRVSCPNATAIGNYAFYGCSSLTSVNIPKVNSNIKYCFQNTPLLKVNLPNWSVYGGYSMETNPTLAELDLTAAYRLATNTFNGCTNLSVLVLRHDGVVSLQGINAFSNTPFASGKAGGTLYVPSAQIANYQAATNWSTILGYADNQILPIEGSIYETQYVDGTPIA